MADLHETRQKFKLVLIGLGVVDLLAVVLWFSPLVGSTAERQAQLAYCGLSCRKRRVKWRRSAGSTRRLFLRAIRSPCSIVIAFPIANP